MTEQERIEGINSEQLATATDRVLLASRFGRARPSSPHLYARSSSPHLYARRSESHGSPACFYTPQTDAPLYAPQGDAPRYAPQAPARGSSPEIFAPNLAHDARDLSIAPHGARDLSIAPHGAPDLSIAPHGAGGSLSSSTPPAPAQYARGSSPDVPSQYARGISPDIHIASSARRDEQTVFTRLPRHTQARAAWRRFTTTALVTTLISVATAIALLL